MPQYKQLSTCYLPKVFQNDFDKIKVAMANSRISLMCDESQDICDRATICTLASFFDRDTKTKRTVLIDVEFISLVNHSSVCASLDNAVACVDKTYDDIIAIATDSASYMKSMIKKIRTEKNIPNLIHVSDVAHLVHIAVDKAIGCGSPLAISCKQFVTKMGAVFKNSPKMYAAYKSVCNSMDMDAIKPPAFVPIRWTSYFDTVITVIKMWQPIKVFLVQPPQPPEPPQLLQSESEDEDTEIEDAENETTRATKPEIGKKMQKLIALFNYENSTNIYTFLLYLEERLKPILILQKVLESSTPIIYKIHRNTLAAINAETSKTWQPKNEGSCRMIFQNLNVQDQRIVTAAMKKFSSVLKTEWRRAFQRNVSDSVRSAWEIAGLLDPFQKNLFVPINEEGDLDNRLKTIFQSHDRLMDTEKLLNLKRDVEKYMEEAMPENKEIEILQYWVDSAERYPVLSELACDILSIPIGSCDAERAFSALRHIQTEDRNRMSQEYLRMYLILYFNK